MANEDAMRALMSIEGFRSLNADIATIINKSEAVKKAKKESETLTSREKKELSAEEKEFKSKRKEIQEKLIKFATRIPIFMYLSDYRENTLKDVITQLESSLFKKVTGLDVKDFNLLCELNVFNTPLMNDAVWKFKRYEDASLVYTGLRSRHANEAVGLFDTVLSAEEYGKLYSSQQSSMSGLGYDNSAVPSVAPVAEDDSEEDDDEPALIVRAKPAKAEEPLAIGKISAPVPVPRSIPTPKPNAPAKSTPANKIDTSGVRVGSPLRHKTFGNGVVKSLDNQYISVTFNGDVKRFKFPVAILDGFLEIV